MVVLAGFGSYHSTNAGVSLSHGAEAVVGVS